MKSKLKIIIPTIIALAAVIIAAVCISFTPKASQNIDEMLSTAQKYLIEQNYEQAVIEFNKIIELDPMNAEAYLGLAKAYISTGGSQIAVSILENGFVLTGDPRISEMIANLSDEQLTLVLKKLIENPDASIEQYQLDAITAVIIYGNDFYYAGIDEIDDWEINGFCKTDKDRYEITFDDGTEKEFLFGTYTSLDFLMQLRNVRDVTVSYNQINDITALRGLNNITSLDLSENLINETNALINLTKLSCLDLAYNHITDISELSNLNLQYLSIENNQISDISALYEHTHLTDLDLSNNLISNIEPLSKLTNLEFLDLSQNQISDISVLFGLTEFRQLILHNNQISKSDIETLKQSLPNCLIS